MVWEEDVRCERDPVLGKSVAGVVGKAWDFVIHLCRFKLEGWQSRLGKSARPQAPIGGGGDDCLEDDEVRIP